MFGFEKRSIYTISKTDSQLFCQKVRQRISVMKTKSSVFVLFKTKRKLKCQFTENTECVGFFTEILWLTFDEIIDNSLFSL